MGPCNDWNYELHEYHTGSVLTCSHLCDPSYLGLYNSTIFGNYIVKICIMHDHNAVAHLF